MCRSQFLYHSLFLNQSATLSFSSKSGRSLWGIWSSSLMAMEESCCESKLISTPHASGLAGSLSVLAFSHLFQALLSGQVLERVCGLYTVRNSSLSSSSHSEYHTGIFATVTFAKYWLWRLLRNFPDVTLRTSVPKQTPDVTYRE